MGYDPSEVVFMSLCFFEETPGPASGTQLKGVRGVVALTDSEMCVMDGAVGIAPTQHFIKIPFSEIESVGSSKDLVEIVSEDNWIRLVAFDWDDFRSNAALTGHIHQSLLTANVSDHEIYESYSWSRLSPRANTVSNHPGEYFPRTDKAERLQAINQEITARDKEFERMHGR